MKTPAAINVAGNGSERFRVRASLTLPIALFVFFGGVGILMLITSIVKGINVAPGIGLIALGSIFFFGISAESIELTGDELIFREFLRKRSIRIGEIREIFLIPVIHPVKFRVDVHHNSDESKNISTIVSLGIFHSSEVDKIFELLSGKGIRIHSETID